MLPEEFSRRFAEVVRHERKLQKLSQETLAERADLSMRMISLVECNRRNPSLQVAKSIARGLGVPLWQLVRHSEESRRTKQVQKKK